MTSVAKPDWWSFLASHYSFTDNSVGGLIDDETLLSDLHTYVAVDLQQIINPAFLANFSNIVQPSSSVDNSQHLIATDGDEEIFIGYGGMDYLGGTSGDNILYGGVGRDMFSPGGGVDFVIGSETGALGNEKDTVSYLTAGSAITVLREYGREPSIGGGGGGLLPNQDVHVLTYDDWVNGPVQYIPNFEVGVDGDYVDVSNFLQTVGYVGTDPVADGYVRLKDIGSGMKIQFDPDGFGGVSPSSVAVLEGLTVAEFSVADNLWIDPTPPGGGSSGGGYVGDSFLTYVIDDGHGSYDVLFDVENIVGSDFNDTIYGHTLEDNLLYGMIGEDYLFGEGGNDVLVGGLGLDSVDGGDGDDLILIGKGGDVATGGAGADIFKFDATIGTDFTNNVGYITDFEIGVSGDKLDLSEVLIYGGYTGSDALGDSVVNFIQNGGDTEIVVDYDGLGSEIGQVLAVLQGVNAAEIDLVENLVLTAPKTLLVSVLGQSNAEGLRVFDGDSDSGVTRMQDMLEAEANFNTVVMPPDDENGKIVMQAIGSTRVDGNSDFEADEVWWYPNEGLPGEILIRAVDMMANQIAEQRALGAVKPVVVWGQGESDSILIGDYSTEAERLVAQDRYRDATLAVFDYIKAHLGDDIEFYIMQTGRYNYDAAIAGGTAQTTAERTLAGLPYIRAAQEDMALMREDIHLAVNYMDLPLISEVDPVNNGTDTWHFHGEERELIGDRVGDFIALEMGQDLVLDDPGSYPLHMLYDLDLIESAGLTVTGNANDNIVVGTKGNDILAGGEGDDALYGGEGVDQVFYVNDYSDYNVITDGTTGWTTVIDLVGLEGMDTLIEIETIHFSNGVYQNGVFIPDGSNQPPVAQDDAFSEDQDIDILGNVLADNGSGVDSDPDLDPLNVVAGVYATANGSVTLAANGDFTYTPNAGFFGVDTFDYTLEDGQGNSDTGTVTFTVNQVVVPNDPPVAQDDAFSEDQDIDILGNVLADNGSGVDSDPDLDPLNVVAGVYATANGSVTLAANGDFTYTPNAGFFGVDTFDYTLEDGQGNSDTGTVTFTVNQVVVSEDDTFIGTAAVEVFDGGIGNDTVDYSASTAAIDIDLLDGSASGGFAAGDTLISIENIIGADIDQRDYIYGSDGANILMGMAGDDIITGGKGADIIDGGDGRDYSRYKESDAAVFLDLEANINTGGDAEGDLLYNIEAIQASYFDDVVYGSNNDDWISGERGDDILAGRLGRDDLFGKSGADTFIFEADSAFADVDRVRDFSTVENDKIDISDILTAYDPFTELLTDFVQITDDGTNSYLAVDANGLQDSIADFVVIAEITGVTGITDEDLLVANGNLVV